MAKVKKTPSSTGTSAGGRSSAREAPLLELQPKRPPAKSNSSPHAQRKRIGGQVSPASSVPRSPTSPIAVYSGTFGRAEAERLLWRAGFGPAKGQGAALASLGVRKAVAWLTRPKTAETFVGPEPVDNDGKPLRPADKYGHDHLWWLDRMIRTTQPLTQRMALVWHDWFANSDDKVNQPQLMLDQNETFRSSGLGSFHELLVKITKDPAMLVFLDGIYNHKGNINENYGREVMELFTLGADRGAYTEDDVREMGRAFSGWDADYRDGTGWVNFSYSDRRHDSDPKTIFGHTGNYAWKDACKLCVENTAHASYFVDKLWSYFIPTPPSTDDRNALEYVYVANGYAIRPVVEAILLHPDLYTGETMVKQPVLYVAGMMRALGLPIKTEDWVYLCDDAGQRLFYPPNVAGWDESRWLDTNTIRSRWYCVSRAVQSFVVDDLGNYDNTETSDAALKSALQFWGKPVITSNAKATLTTMADDAVQGTTGYQAHAFRGERQNALRQLIAAGPDGQVC